MSQIIVAKLSITGMHCTACAMNIDFDLEDLAGIVSCKTSYATQTTEVTYDADIIDAEAIVARIGTIGYSAVVQS